MNWLLPSAILLLLSAAGAGTAAAQASPLPSTDVRPIYERLLEQINTIPIYDNHSHATFPDDSDMDAQAAPPGESSVVRLRDDNPEFVAAAKSLFGYPYDDFQPEHAKWLIDKKKAAEKDGGTAYWDGILDKLNIETCLANRVALAPFSIPSASTGFSSLIPSSSRSITAIRPAKTPTWAFTSRSRRKFFTATCSRSTFPLC